ncbi:MAG: nucleotidyltransferase family protein [Gemmatimonadota bacterium]
MSSRFGSVVGIVLAAGRSQRMGKPKPLLEIDGRTFLERAITTLLSGGCAPVIVVLSRSESAQAMREIAESAGAQPVENPNLESEPIDSLPVAVLLGAFESQGSIIVRPVFADRAGHPILLGRSIWDELAGPDLPEGMRTVVRRHAAEINDVTVNDPGVRTNIDTPDDYERELERRRCEA